MKTESQRLLSLDFFRGLTMFFLIAEFAHLFPYFVDKRFEGTILFFIGQQLHHCAWEGLHFWDLIQPFFMFIVGVAMPLSFAKRRAAGHSPRQLTYHVLKRSLLLLILGWALYCIPPGKIVFRFDNVLAQLSVTYLLAYLVMNRRPWFQVAFSIFLLLITEGLYRFFPVEGYDRAFTAGENFGAWFNLFVQGQPNEGYWAIFNAFPTAAHTIWGVLAGKLLIGKESDKKKLGILLIAGAAGLALGYGLSPVTPIIKRISTSTFVMASGGWTFWALALSYWVIEVRKFRKVMFFAIVGMNPLFIYLFSHAGGAVFLSDIIHPFTSTIFSWAGEWFSGVITGLLTLFCLWFICYWLFRRKIFIRI